jgi:hypothetical protein
MCVSHEQIMVCVESGDHARVDWGERAPLCKKGLDR